VTANILCGARFNEWSCGRPISHDGDHADGAMFWPNPQPKTVPLPQRLRAAAETIEELNARDGLGLNATVSPGYLRKEADRMSQEVQP